MGIGDDRGGGSWNGCGRVRGIEQLGNDERDRDGAEPRPPIIPASAATEPVLAHR
ncbi:MAG TPA: hypothetical protein VLW51_07990 [Solirubrobacteraceae bacterium]|nr:hypothetical protein [Solirubrobacteraceae bacterium]